MPINFDFPGYLQAQEHLARIEAVVDWTISCKRKVVKGNEYHYYYKQFIDKQTGKRKDVYIPKKELAERLAEFDEKKSAKSAMQFYKHQLQQMDPATARQVRAMAQCYNYFDFETLARENAKIGEIMHRPDYDKNRMKIKQVGGDGTLYDSRAEVVLDVIFKALGIKTVHNEPLEPWKFNSRTFDFTFEINHKKYYLEHFGKLEEPAYALDQQQKLFKYRANNIVPEDNLIILKSLNQQMIIPEMLWELMRYQIVTPRKLKKLFQMGDHSKKYGISYHYSGPMNDLNNT